MTEAPVVLYAIVVELVVKHVWEQELATTAEHTHNVHKLFKQLRPETRTEIEAGKFMRRRRA